jgi:hypothetical protein
MKSDIPDNKQDNLLENLEDLATTSSDQESFNDDLTAGAPSDRQIDESPSECYQNDGLKVESKTGGSLYAFGVRIDTSK